MGVSATYPLLPGIPGTPTSKGGEIPLAPFAQDDFRVSIRRPPTKDEIFDLLRRVTEGSYHIPIIEDPRGSVAVYRQMACQAQVVADKGFRSQQSTFYLTYPTQGDLPATSLRAATMNVVLQRTKNRDVSLIAEIATIVLFGPHGRTYVNAERVVWSPFDQSDQKTVEFISQNPGFVGNLDHLADDNGLITNPDGSAATDIVGLQSQGGTTNVYADIIGNATGPSALVDQGKPDTFSEADVGLYVEILTATNPENVGRLLKVVGFSQPGVEDPPGTGLFPRHILVDDESVQTQIFVALNDDGSLSFTNETTEARSETADDMNLMVTPGLNDGYYFGGTEQFSELEITISTPGVGTWEITWQYWDGGNYAPLTGVIDNTIGFTAGGTQRVSWTVPSNWSIDVVDGVAAYYVRAQVTSFTSATTSPLGQIAYIFELNQLTPELDDEFGAATGSVEWAIRDWSDLGVEIIQIEAPTGGRDNILRLLGEERGVYQQNGETDDSFRERAASLAEVVSPNAIRNVVNRALEPFNLKGVVVDVATGGTFETFDGWFWDFDAWDYYEADVVQFAIADDGGVGTDETAAAQNDTPNDMNLLPPTVAVLDRYYFGQSTPFSALDLDISTAGIGDWVIEWRYFNGVTSTLLSDVDDNSDAFKNPGIRRISWTVPGDWATENPFGVGSAYYVEARVTSVTTTTQQPLGRQARTAFEFPEEQYKLLLSGKTGEDGSSQFGETYGWFFVILPCLAGTDDFGFAWDINEPANVVDGEILATAWDIMVFDGFSTSVNAAYAEIYNQVDRIRAGGIGFTMLRDCSLNEPICP
jgi:hypothetical protein